ncbi:putative f0F1 ATP synthase subunit alpha (plasmid) [Bacillus cereus E33L]|uniref:ATP F0F1 synthase subunit alpha n=2 Tax=Bacillus cereus TaxID=1396 RepID=Q4V1U2_BACCZ|nr:uncharacterized protein pE33L466_0155 [Bacillus cereus E33L]AJI26022.1 putative f0F1 ATP synthase subunit alpha [Bacillus cereus E33L]
MNMKKVVLAGALGFSALVGTNLPGLEITKASAAVQEIHSKIEGEVVEVSKDSFILEAKQGGQSVTVHHDFQTDVKVGEYVRVTSDEPLLQNAFHIFTTAASIEHITLAPGVYKGFVVGHVSKVYPLDTDGNTGVDVEFPTEEGETGLVFVELTQGQSFQVNDIVQVEDGWFKTNPPFTYDGIEKVKSKVDSAKKQVERKQWVWS